MRSKHTTFKLITKEHVIEYIVLQNTVKTIDTQCLSLSQLTNDEIFQVPETYK